MKKLMLASMILIAGSVFAKDMSRTENYKTSYKEMPSGEVVYIGQCSTHEDYENKKFNVTKVLVKYFEPSSQNKQEYFQKMRNVDPKLIKAVSDLANLDYSGTLLAVDDITLDKIQSRLFPNLDLYRFSIGVGGGNGFFAVFQKIGTRYELMSHTFDGDLEFCHEKVWTTRR
jgi:hypothetical protein